MTNLFLTLQFTKVALGANATVGSATPTVDIVAISPDVIVSNFYQIALMVSGLLAFGVIVFGALRYTLAAGNPSIQSDARDQITQAILGLLLLLGIYLILNTINPNLTALKLPPMTPLSQKFASTTLTMACYKNGTKIGDCFRGTRDAVKDWCLNTCKNSLKGDNCGPPTLKECPN